MDRLFEKTPKEESSEFGSTPVEPECVLVEVGLHMIYLDRALVGAEEPPLHERRRLRSDILRTWRRGLRPKLPKPLDLGAVALLRHVHGLAVIVDPSHAAGRADIRAPLARAAPALEELGRHIAGTSPWSLVPGV